VTLPADAAAPDADTVVVLIELFDGASGNQGVLAVEAQLHFAGAEHRVEGVVPIADVERGARRDRQRPALRMDCMPLDDEKRSNEGEKEGVNARVAHAEVCQIRLKNWWLVPVSMSC